MSAESGANDGAPLVGWFGPVGAAAIVHATWADVWKGHRDLWVFGSLVIVASILAHGVTATALTRLYTRR